MHSSHVRPLTRREKILAWLLDHLGEWEARISDKQWEKHYGSSSIPKYHTSITPDEMAGDLKERAREAGDAA